MSIWIHKGNVKIYVKNLTLGAFCDNVPAPVAMVTLLYEAAWFGLFDYTAMIKTLGERQREGGRCALFKSGSRFYLQAVSTHSLVCTLH